MVRSSTLAAASDLLHLMGTPKINRQTTYYDNKPFNVYVAEGDTELKIIVSGLPANVMAQIFGKHFDETKGVTFDSGEPETPYFALGFKFSMGISDARYYWYYKGVFSGGAEAGTTMSISAKKHISEYMMFPNGCDANEVMKLKNQAAVSKNSLKKLTMQATN